MEHVQTIMNLIGWAVTAYGGVKAVGGAVEYADALEESNGNQKKDAAKKLVSGIIIASAGVAFATLITMPT